MRDWLIRKLGGIPKPQPGQVLIAENADEYRAWLYEGSLFGAIAHISRLQLSDMLRNELVEALGGIPLPEAGEGKVLVRPTVRKLPHRKKINKRIFKNGELIGSFKPEEH